MVPSDARLNRVKLLHTVAWGFFVLCIGGIFAFAWAGNFRLATIAIGLVTVESLVLAFNSWSCPLTAVAARYTDYRRANFDIYLPEWLARYNKQIFGPLFVAGVLFTVARWLGWIS